MSLITELKRRNVLRVVSAYAVVGWLVLQGAKILFPVYEISDNVIKLIVVCMGIGLIPVVVLSWVFQFTPDGLKLDKDVDASSAAVQASTKKLDRVVIVLLGLALVYFALDKFVFQAAGDKQQLANVEQPAQADTLAESASIQERQALPHSVAVLPFDNLSPDPDDAYFAYGIHESIINDLAKIQAMNVIARPSVIRYAESEMSMKEIADECGRDYGRQRSLRW